MLISVSASGADWFPIDWLRTTNLWVASPLANAEVRANVGSVYLYGTNAVNPTLSFTKYGSPGWNELFWLQNNAFYVSGVPIGGGTAIPINIVGNVSVTGNINASGAITGATNILNVTNVFSTTNSFYYPTNAQTAVVNLGTTYGDYQVDGSAPIAFSIQEASKVADVYQTAVVLLRNTSGNVTNITGANIHFQGTPFVTNRTVVTFFYHGLAGDLFTNATCLPLW